MQSEQPLIIAPGEKEDSPIAIAIMGPTATGKTDLALKIAETIPVEIISVDSALVYRGMDIGTAKPSAEERALVPHHLIDIREPDQAYSAAEFREDCLQLMQEITARGKIPLLAGGTMLYYRALQEGLSTLPSADENVRARIEQDAAEIGWAAMHDRLKTVDPVAAERIHPNDPQRISRALEVYEITGQSMTDLWQQQTETRLPYRLIKIVLFPEDRTALHARIEKRFRQMIDNGFIDEVESLKKYQHVHIELPSMRSVGYRQVLEYLEGQYDLPEMINKGIYATRQLAKRQITWLRKEENANFYDPATLSVDDLLKILHNSLS